MKDDILAVLAQSPDRAADGDSWRPLLFDLADDGQAAELQRLFATGAVLHVHDTIAEQLRELMAVRDPRRLPAAELDRRVEEHLAGRDPRLHGTWVFYPWSGRLVHLLTREEFRQVRADRNRYKITSAEQASLATRRIGVIGLSVGNMAAITMALEGIGGMFRLADFDQLGLSNLNRLRGAVHDLGVEKTVLAARELFEIDPWLEIELHRDGVQPETVDDYLVGGGRLDLVVEECDDLGVKLLARERARAHRIPVVMDTSDRGLLDVERFDLEPDRAVLHGLVGDVSAASLRGMTALEKVPIVLAIVDERQISTRMAVSLPEVERTIGGWPQLASGVALGGALVADAARRILLGEFTASGRYYVDPADLVADDRGALREPVDPPPAFEVAPEARRLLPLPPQPDREDARNLAPAAIRWIAALGTAAPSGHNNQPWTLRWWARDSTLECRHDPSRDLPILDFELGGTWVAFGALIENVRLAARHLGLDPLVQPWPDPSDPGLVAAIRLTPGHPGETDPLLAQVTARVTNRRRDPRVPLADADAAALLAGCAGAGVDAQLRLLREPADLDDLAALIGAGDRVALLDQNLHHDISHAFRWTPDEVRAQPHGLDVATLEYNAAERAALRLSQHWRIMEAIGRLTGGRGLEDGGRQLVGSASAVGLITVPGTGRHSYLRGGQALQRTWLTASAHGLSFQPLTGLPYLFARLERGHGAGLADRTQNELRELRGRFGKLFDTRPDQAEVFLFRVGRAGPPTARSLRRPLDDILTIVSG
ncbi:Rv1355c family protein [Frankia sp. AgB1.9]|uniref:Rv1355c family protein n=1 Tax=unclassified Frankia TaxID=2632575 RepID=UPI0019341935|nr:MULTISPECIES: Rv1355c family protein [unclassified Frankia]MBL7492572.1 Rv1355c family protein [Frankia sp. AgW1.1]MBL7548725.1 Rv1355c family protein [Frankia sp. AgB1.9]MBL7619323.1 Rv1355c family protein [Frankia sp. AgB1.8]